MMNELKNQHTAPITVTDWQTSERVTIAPGHTALVSGDFSQHLFVKSGMLGLESLDDESETSDKAPVAPKTESKKTKPDKVTETSDKAPDPSE
ncbi:Uncharacterised protein [Yersinia pseudotuberculosis]|uniref:hypothetical protein n=1 Tax=Yersinia pseudotuberculosis TaxID=633 RepID=UPI0005E77AA0|nr:hypothetical protein [Yersinia pseudotuberculosis]CNL65244.1 Uncharacterised protein [Yersinia pseudotuberculosis]